MSNILGLLLSFVLIFPTILYGVDLFAVNSIKIALESQATTIGYQISKQGGLRENLIAELSEQQISVNCLGECNYINVGQTLTFQLTKYYTPILISQEKIAISVTRTTIVGYL